MSRRTRNTQRSGQRFTDAFDTPIADSTTNLLDVASHYPYSPERWRVFVDGSRVFPEYDAVPQYNHDVSVHQLMPLSGETVRFETAERPRYVASYELEISTAFNISRLLAEGDSVRFGAWTEDDGWYIEQTGSQPKHIATMVVLDNGSPVVDKDVDLKRNFRNFCRYELITSWYRVGPQRWRQTFTQDGQAINDFLGSTSVEPSGGPRVGNLPYAVEITRGSGNAPITLNQGTVAYKNLGRTTPFVRVKKYDIQLTTGNVANSWFPLAAIRKSPGRIIVNLDIVNLRILEYSGAGDIQVLIRASSQTKVLDAGDNPIPDSDFYSPIEMTPTGSVVQVATTVEKAPNGAGTPVLSVTGNDPSVLTDRMGGYQVGAVGLYAGGPGTAATRRTSEIQQKRSLYSDDLGVKWVRAENTGETLVLEVTTEQQW